MALLGDIRKRSGLLIVIIGFALLAFLVGDIFGRGDLFGNPNELGSVAGTPISAQDYNVAYNRLSQMPQLQQAGENTVSEMAWNQLVQERVVTDKMSDLGLVVSEDQYLEQAGRFYQSVNPNLVDANGRVNTQLTKQFLAELKAAAQQGNPQAQNFYNQWENSNPQAVLLANQLTSLVSSGGLATDVDAQYVGNNKNSAEIEYVAIQYNDYIQNDSIEVTDDEILAYMKARPKTFKPQPTVNLAYAVFPGVASEEDESKVLNELNSYLSPQILRDDALGTVDTIQSFANAKNDSIYVSRFSDSQFDSNYYTRQQFEGFPAGLKDQLMTASKGDIIGPTKVGDVYNLIKVTDVKPINDSVKTSHILIGYAGSQARSEGITRSPEEAQAMADSLLTVIKSNPSKFNELARTVSDDPVAAKDDGSIGWVGRFQQGFSLPYRNFAINNPRGTIDVVQSEFGFHIIRIDDVKQKTGYKLANIQKQVRASEETQENLFNLANQIALDAQGNSANDFINAARRAGAEVNNSDGVTRFQNNLVGLTGTGKDSDILKWAFDSDTQPKGVKTFEMSNGGQIVAYLSNRFEEGNYNVPAARESIENRIRNNKIAEKIAADNAGNIDLNAVASKYGTSVENANINFNQPSLAGLGVEPKIAGAAMGLAEGKTSGAIQGNNAVYFIKVNNKSNNASANTTADKQIYKSQVKNKLNSQLINALVEAADIEDNRVKLLK
ncbi:hypothetical protein GO491_02375 [Flavobacteriaceae bacterium Ap0902]|nr:hypothetical protein [Flavobacteriaceae bacterium Ap0902]